MSLIDIIIITVSIFAFWVFLSNRKLLEELHIFSGLALILAGLALLAAFYLSDLATMFILPLFIPMNEAMHVMRELHLNYMWLVSAISISFIVIGLVYLIKKLLPNIITLRDKLEETQEELREEILALKCAEQRLIKNEDKLKELTLVDSLTSVTNRRGYDRFIRDEWNRAKRTQSSISAIMMDVDFFKDYNDNYGHLAGDQCLRKIATALRSKIVRAGDIIARYGGEEFVVILPGSDSEDAAKLAEILRLEVESLNIEHKLSKAKGRITISLGVATTTDPSGSYEALLLEADTAMYEAKKKGRNQVKVA
jgi:diguanylate cyclase (GGDEF)-like protein